MDNAAGSLLRVNAHPADRIDGGSIKARMVRVCAMFQGSVLCLQSLWNHQHTLFEPLPPQCERSPLMTEPFPIFSKCHQNL